MEPIILGHLVNNKIYSVDSQCYYKHFKPNRAEFSYKTGTNSHFNQTLVCDALVSVVAHLHVRLVCGSSGRTVIPISNNIDCPLSPLILAQPNNPVIVVLSLAKNSVLTFPASVIIFRLF